MRFHELTVEGAFLLEPDLHADGRGFFTRTWCSREFADHGLDPRLVQSSLSFSRVAYTLRGMHYQAAPHPEVKVVRCTRGAAYAVAADLRPASSSFRRWTSVSLTPENRHALYVPAGCAFGALSLAADTELFYQISEFYFPDLARGFRYDDPAFAIAWPAAPAVISERDRLLPLSTAAVE
jgi:dTDP-4-dehydrorhamnose 3,5-epimerase